MAQPDHRSILRSVVRSEEIAEAARSLGRSARIVKTEPTGMHHEPTTPVTPVENAPRAGLQLYVSGLAGSTVVFHHTRSIASRALVYVRVGHSFAVMFGVGGTSA